MKKSDVVIAFWILAGSGAGIGAVLLLALPWLDLVRLLWMRAGLHLAWIVPASCIVTVFLASAWSWIVRRLLS